MFCRSCYSPLNPDLGYLCPRCRRAFVADDPKTYLMRPFPTTWRIVWHVILTTLIAMGVAFLVSTFQLAAASGH